MIKARPGVLAALMVAIVTVVMGQTPPDPKRLTQNELFTSTKIWTAHLVFSPKAWSDLQPTRNGMVFGVGPTAADWRQGRNGERNGYATARGIQFNYAHADLDVDGTRLGDVAVRYKGNGTFNERSAAAWKESYKIDLNKYVKGQKLAGVSTLNFHNAITDPSYMNEVLAYRLFRDAGVPAPRTAYVRVYVTVTGQVQRRYAGLYWLTENIDTNFIDARFKTKDGAIFKPDTLTPFKDLGNAWSGYAQTYDPKTDITPADEARVMEFCKLVSNASAADFAARIGTFVDLAAFARFLAVVAWFNNPDSILERGHNYYMYLDPKTRMFTFVPWDQDHAFGNFGDRPGNVGVAGNVLAPSRLLLLDRILAVPAFRDLYVARLREFTKTIFQPNRFPAQVKEVADAIRPDIGKEPPKPSGPRLPSSVDNLTMFDRLAAGGGVGAIVPFVTDRTRIVEAQLSRVVP